MTLVRWTFVDPSDSSSYTFAVNPNVGGSPAVKKQTTPLPLTASDGALVVFEGRNQPTTIDWSGATLDQSQYTAVVAWFAHRHQLVLTDDLGRTNQIYITGFTPKRAGLTNHPWRMTYQVKALVLSSTLQNLISANDSSFELATVGGWSIVAGFTAIGVAGTVNLGWPDLGAGSYSLQLTAADMPADNVVQLNDPIAITPDVLYRVRMRFYIQPDGDAVVHGVFIGGIEKHRRQVTMIVLWYCDVGGSSVLISEKYVGPFDQVGVFGPQTAGGVVKSPPMPVGGVNMFALLQVILTNGAEQFQPAGSPIVVDTIYLDSVRFSQ